MTQPKTALGPSRLSKILAGLTTRPRLELRSLQSLKLTLAAKNDHFGARHFVREQLPRIRYANPDLNIQVSKLTKHPSDQLKPQMMLTFSDGGVRTLDLQDKWSTTIVKELMDVAGCSSWQKWKEEASELGLPVVPGEEREGRKVAKKPQRISTWKKPSSTRLGSPLVQIVGANLEVGRTSHSSQPKAGAAAVLP